MTRTRGVVRGLRRWPSIPPAAPAVRLALVGAVLATATATAPPSRSAVAAQAEGSVSARQVTLFAVVATPGAAGRAIDPKLKRIEPQLRKLLPGHGFKLIEVRSKRLDAGDSVRCDLGRGLSASTALVEPLDENGKVVLRCALTRDGSPLFDTMVATPPNQLFFCDRPLDDGTRLLIGVGAR